MPLQKNKNNYEYITFTSIRDFHVAVYRKTIPFSPSQGARLRSLRVLWRGCSPRPASARRTNDLRPQNPWAEATSPGQKRPTPAEKKGICFFLDNIQPKSSKKYISLFWKRLIWFNFHLFPTIWTTFVRWLDHTWRTSNLGSLKGLELSGDFRGAARLSPLLQFAYRHTKTNAPKSPEKKFSKSLRVKVCHLILPALNVTSYQNRAHEVVRPFFLIRE